MTAGVFNPLDLARTTSSRPAETNTGAGTRQWFSDSLRSRPKAQDLNRIIGSLRDVIDYFGVTDVEGDDTLLRLAILKAFRPKLTTNTTFYVRTDGNDANTGLVYSAGGAFLTIQAAVNAVYTYDLGGFTATIQVDDGTYTAGFLCAAPWPNGNVIIQGNVATPANCIISTSGTNICAQFSNCFATIQGFKLTSTAGTLLNIARSSNITVGAMEYGATTGIHISTGSATACTMSANYTISGGGSLHWNVASSASIVIVAGLTITLTGTPAFTNCFVQASQLGCLVISVPTFVGTATGVRYKIYDGSDFKISPATQDPDTFLPGDQLGVIYARFDGTRGFRNILHNSTGRLQSGGPAGTVANDVYGLHNRWYALTQSGPITPTTLADVQNGLQSMIRLTNSYASTQRMIYAQIIEGQNCKHLRGRQVCLSWWYRRSATTAVRFTVLEWTGTEDAVISNVVNNWASSTFTPGNFYNTSNLTVSLAQQLTPALANTIYNYNVVGTLSSSFTNLIVLVMASTAAVNGETLDFTLQLEEGGLPTRQERRPMSVEEAICSRYYEQKTVQSMNGARHIPLLRKRAAPSVTVGVGSAGSITADGFELTHTTAAACSVVANAEL